MLEVLKAADRALDACGRPVAPPGYRYVDLPYVIPMKATFTPPSSPNSPYQIRVKNNSLTEFICKGMVIAANFPVRVKWPSGRYLSQRPLPYSLSPVNGGPLGAGGNMLTLDSPEIIGPGANIAIEISGV